MNTREYELPVIALRGMTVLPDMVIHFDISRKKSIHAVERSMIEEQKLFLVTQKNPEVVEPGMKDIYTTGTVAVIKQIIKMPNNIVRVLVEGIEKATVDGLSETDNMLFAKVSVEERYVEQFDELTEKAMIDNLYELIRQYAVANPKMSKDVLKQWLDIRDVKVLLRRFSIDFPMHYTQRQALLEINTTNQLFESISKMLTEEIQVYHIKDELTQKVKDKVESHQKEYILREQMRVISQELDGEDVESETDEFFSAVKKLKASKEIKSKINKEIKRYKTLTTSSSEAGVLRGYIETLLEMPWDNMSKDNDDIKEAEAVLNADHYGLEKVKERIIESLTVRAITKKGDSPVICLVGPPGTGKTSIARSVAKALDKKYVRICLGGVRDEAEIRGHRKTYIGAMPGRIVNGMKTAGVKNPLVLLDEIDKISSDYKGDTASALLEVLDGEQNSKFVDHYIELPTDLSEVLFIATANDLSEVSKPLIDRMEIIEVGSYTANEKFHIAKEHLVPKQIEKNGLNVKQLSFNDKALKVIIEGYTMESGVRNLEREIGAICRKVVKDLYIAGAFEKNDKRNTKIKKVCVTDKNLEQYLGKMKYIKDEADKADDIGVVRGLAWTSAGGDTLQVEVNTMPGTGELKLTGQMGDIMKESAEIALSYVRSIACEKEYHVPKNYFEKHNLHLHIPEGAVPKDGPSAGITMATAILSAVTSIPVKASVAMTGEITLRGKVLPIGGLKEKLLAAKAAGIKMVLVPEKNRRDIMEFKPEITKGVKIVYASEMEQVLSYVLAERI